MIFHPAIIGLFLSSAAILFMALYCSFYGLQIIRRWDIRSGSELQLLLERRTYLLSVFLSVIFTVQILSGFLFIFTVDQLSHFFTGAMCAAGSLSANVYGYPTLVFKILALLPAGIWLILNYVDNRAVDYPLVRTRYILLLALMPILVTEAVLQASYFIHLKPNIITSCCGTLFSGESAILDADNWNLPSPLVKLAFFGCSAAVIGAGIYNFRSGNGAWILGGVSLLNLAVSLFSIISFISPYIYELPTHHCPFCLLQKEYGYIGYPLYTALFGGSILGAGTAALEPFRNIPSLSAIIPVTQKRISITAAVLIFVFVMIVVVEMAFTSFVPNG